MNIHVILDHDATADDHNGIKAALFERFDKLTDAVSFCGHEAKELPAKKAKEAMAHMLREKIKDGDAIAVDHLIDLGFGLVSFSPVTEWKEMDANRRKFKTGEASKVEALLNTPAAWTHRPLFTVSADSVAKHDEFLMEGVKQEKQKMADEIAALKAEIASMKKITVAPAPSPKKTTKWKA
jgi:hypothetical protein